MTEGESKTSSCFKMLGIGCVVVIVVVVLAFGVGAYYVKTQWRHWAATGINAVTDDMLADFQLPASDREGVKAEITRFTSQLEAGAVTSEHMQKLMEALQQGPLPGLLFLHAVVVGQVIPADIPVEEAQAARLNAQRLQRAVVEGKVTSQALQDVLKFIPREAEARPKAEAESGSQPPEAFNVEAFGPPKKNMTAEDWRPVMGLIKKLADDAGIPNEPYQLELTQEIRKLLDQVLTASSS